MKVIETSLPGTLILEPQVFGDSRGFFYESYHQARYHDAGIIGDFIQTNVSRSAKGVLRGLHYQWPNPQGKLVSVMEGEVYDVAVDIRQGSPNFGQWIGRDADCRQPSSFLDTGRLCARVLRAV
jgi:dTDP-4-dehydrorhamnose 3,5-epimerase